MHLPRLALLSLLGISALTTAGCNTSTPSATGQVSKVYVRDVAASSLHATDILANSVHDAGVRALSAQGYTVVATEGEADAGREDSHEAGPEEALRIGYSIFCAHSMFREGVRG